jgi:hypothetical protein
MEITDSNCRCCGADRAICLDDSTRSYPHLQRYHVKVRLLFENWPEFNRQTGEIVEFQPSRPEHLRKWLQIMAGYEERDLIVLSSGKPAEAAAIRVSIESAMRKAGAFAFIEVKGIVVVIRSSKSIRYRKMGQKAFNELDQRTSDVAYSVTGMDPEELMKGQELRTNGNKQ